MSRDSIFVILLISSIFLGFCSTYEDEEYGQAQAKQASNEEGTYAQEEDEPYPGPQQQMADAESIKSDYLRNKVIN
jgi:hypothetical protein